VKRFVVIGLSLVMAVAPTQAKDGSSEADQMAVMDFYMHIVPPDWKTLVANGDLPCQLPAHALIKDLSPLMSSVEITCADHRTYVVRQVRDRLQIAPSD
jgi:hypothetical protein